jgi:hypothetical protein
MVSSEALKLNELLCNAPKAVDMVLTHHVAMIGAWIRSRTLGESEQATHNGKEDPVPAPDQDSEEASPT